MTDVTGDGARRGVARSRGVLVHTLTERAAERAAIEEFPVAYDLPGDGMLTDRLLSPMWTSSQVWWPLFIVSGLLVLLFLYAMAVTFVRGIGAWGNNIPVAWAYGITDFVWWIGIGHA